MSSLNDSSINSIGSPGAQKQSPAINQRKRSLRIVVINFQSTRKKGKNIDVLIETTCSNIILGTETWLSDDILSTYFLDQSLGVTVHRRDRPNDPHGGVLIAAKNNLLMINIDKRNDLEFIPGILKITNTKRMMLCSYYRPPDKTSEEYLQQVNDELTALKKRHKNVIFIIGGDFNLPDIDWDKNIVSNKFYPHRVSQTNLAISKELGFEQMVNFSTRQ